MAVRMASRALAIIILLSLAACGPGRLAEDFRFFTGPTHTTAVPQIAGTPTSIFDMSGLGGTPAAMWTPSPTLTPTPGPDTYNFVVLGGDQTTARTARGERTDGHQHTDIFVIVHVVMTEPVQITAILIPRNLWVPQKMMLHGTGIEWSGDMWSMEYYGRTGAWGVRNYVGAVFDLNVNAVVYIRMDNFVTLVDDLNGLDVAISDTATKHMDGAEVLAYLRDNDNNWGCLVYDCGNRIWRVGQTLAYRVLGDRLALIQLSGLWTTDLSLAQVYQFAALAPQVAHGYNVRFVKLWTPEIARGDTPLDVRGMVPTVPLYEWAAGILNTQGQ